MESLKNSENEFFPSFYGKKPKNLTLNKEKARSVDKFLLKLVIDYS